MGLGLLANGHVVETDRAGIVGSYVGHTSANMKELIAKAKGGVLFIDKAYALDNIAIASGIVEIPLRS